MSKLDGINTDMSGKIGKYVYRRTKADGSTRVGTQKMLVVSDILEDYQTE